MTIVQKQRLARRQTDRGGGGKLVEGGDMKLKLKGINRSEYRPREFWEER